MGKEISREDLEHLILDLLEGESVCVIATCHENIPRASTVEFFPLGTKLYILTEGGKKVENISENPRVCIAIHAPFSGWNSVRGVQITGTAEIAGKGSREFQEGLEAYCNRRGLGHCTLPASMTVIKVTPIRIEYVDTSLEKRGYNVRQILEHDER
jgi:general stress protein 26